MKAIERVIGPHSPWPFMDSINWLLKKTTGLMAISGAMAFLFYVSAIAKGLRTTIISSADTL